MTPTTRCAWLVAAVAILATVLPLWLSIALLLVVLAATLADASLVREAPRIEVAVPSILSRANAVNLVVSADPGDARRVLLRQPSTPAFRLSSASSASQLRCELLPLRRGRFELPGVASASVGPLGLGRWHHPDGPARELLVYPNLPRARALALALRTGRAAADGRARRGPLGIGTDFEAIRDYSIDDDIRQVNWLATARLGRPMSNQYRVEQDHDVICMLDCGRLMTAPTGEASALDAAIDAASAIALGADALGDRCGAIAFDTEIRRRVAPRRSGGDAVVRALFDLEARFVDSDFERAFLLIGAIRRSLIVVFTDLLDERAARPLVRAAPMLTRRHAVIIAALEDADLRSALAAADEQPERALAAASLVDDRNLARAQLQRAGAEVALANARELPERCVAAYLRAKRRLRG